MTKVLTAGPVSNNLVIYSQSKRSSEYGAIFSWPDTEEKVVYGFKRGETLWKNQVVILPIHQNDYFRVCTLMCKQKFWAGLLAGRDAGLPVTALVSDGRMLGNVCELELNGKWFTLEKVHLVGHMNAKWPEM